MSESVPGIVDVVWDRAEMVPESQIRHLLASTDVEVVVVPTETLSFGETYQVRASDIDPGPSNRVKLQSRVVAASGEIVMTVTAIPNPVCGSPESVTRIRGHTGCVVQSEPIVQLEWEESGQGFRVEATGLGVSQTTESLGDFVLVLVLDQ